MKKTLTTVVVGLLAAFGLAHAVNIVGYDVKDADPSGVGNWSHTYTGTIADAASGVRGLVDYTGGTGTLADGILPSSTQENQLFLSPASVANAEITLYLAEGVSLTKLEIFGASGNITNNIPGNISGFDVTFGGVTATFLTREFGPSSSDGQLVNDRVRFAGSALEGLVGSVVVLSSFQTQDNIGADPRFSIGEITVNGLDPVPVPAAAPLMLAGLGLMGLRKKMKK